MSDTYYSYEMKSSNIIDPSFFQNQWRVKLYTLNLAGQWDDMGTGHVSIQKEDEDYYIKMTSEISNELMFELKLMDEHEFHRQRGTILTWKKKKQEEDDDTAISFQENEGIREVWRFLCSLKGIDPQEENYEMEEEDNEVLPEPAVENLPYIAREIRPDHPPNKVIKILDCIYLNNGAYIKKLGEVLEEEEKKIEKKSEMTKTTAEELETDADNYKREIDPNFSQFETDQNVIEMLVSDEIFMTTFGALEYDFESQKTIKHRHYFRDIVKFKNPLAIDDNVILSKIRMNHRLAYLRDTAIGRFIEELTIKHINTLIHFNNSEIIHYFLNNRFQLKKVVDKLFEDDLDIKNEGILFILELISCCKDLLQNRLYIFEALCDLNLIEALEKLLLDLTHHSDYINYVKNYLDNKEQVVKSNNIHTDGENSQYEKIKINSIEILINILTVVPRITFIYNLDTLKSYLINKSQKTKEHPLLSELCNLLINQENFGLKFEIGELLKFLLDNEVNEKKNEFYDLFYNKCLTKLLEFLNVPLKSEFKYEIISSKQIIIEIICHCLKQHDGQRVRYWAIHNDLINKVVSVIDHPSSSPSKILQLQVIKFLKSVLINNDENLNKLISNNDSLSPIIEIFKENKKKDNMILSAILDLFEYIKKQNLKKIIFYLFDKHRNFFLLEENKKIFSSLITRYEQYTTASDHHAGNADENKMLNNWKNVREISAKEDEDYFEDDEDDIFRDENNLDEDKKTLIRDDRVNLDEIPDQTFLGHKLEREQDLITVYKNDEVDQLYTALQERKKKKLDPDNYYDSDDSE